MVKTTQVLLKSFVRRWLFHNWITQGKLKIIPTGSKTVLKRHGIEVVDIHEFLRPPRENIQFEPIIGFYDSDIPKGENHPDYKQTPCYMFNDDNVLLEGLEQAKVLTNTVEISEGLPLIISERESSLSLPDEFHLDLIKRIKVCSMFDATQEKLPRRKDPERPMYKFRRSYGISTKRKLELTCKNLLLACEQFATNVSNNAVIYDGTFHVPFKAHKKNIKFNLSSEIVVTTKNRLSKMANPSVTQSVNLPDLHPVDCTVSLTPVHFYSMETLYPVSIKSKWPYVSLAFVHFDKLAVKNLYGEPVTENQIIGRSLLKGFTIAVAQARAIYGDEVEMLPEPVVVPVVQTDGMWFHFTIYQLNTTSLDENSQIKNIFWQSPMINLYKTCEFQKGRPIFEGYNPSVINRLVTLYNFY